MDISSVISIFFTVFILVDPLGLIPVFVTFLSKYNPVERKNVILKTILVATGISLFFIFFGKYILQYLGVSPGAFLIAGGILLFLISIDLILARPTRTKLPPDGSEMEKEDVFVFPLAFPMIAGPGTIAALTMFSSQSKETCMLFVISCISILVLMITMIVMFMSSFFERLLRKTGISVIERIMGLVLSSLAVQFILNGLHQAGVVQ